MSSTPDHVLVALNASIEKWERNALAEHPHEVKTSPADCPLCNLFYGGKCVGCPVRERTKVDGCAGTPYDGAAAASAAWRYTDADKDQYATVRDRFRQAAAEEVAFLKSLLPEAAEGSN